jgi:hypothetical protein
MNEYAKDIEIILTNSAQNCGIEPYDGGFVSSLGDEAKAGLPPSAVFVLAFDTWKDAVSVAKEAKRMADSRRKLLPHVCTGHGHFKTLFIATLI